MTFPVPQNLGTLFAGMGWEEPVSRQKWWVLLRWILMGVVMLTTLIGYRLIHLDIPIRIVLVLCLIAFLVNAFFHYVFFRRSQGRPDSISETFRGWSYAQFAVDWVFITLILHFTGGVASPLLFYLLIHVILSGVLLEKRAFMVYVTVIAVTINCMAFLKLGGFIPHIYNSSFISRNVQGNIFFILLLLFFCNLALFMSSSFVAWFFMRYKERILALTELQEKLEQTNRRLGLLNQVARDTILTLGLKPRLDFICQSMVQLMDLKGAAIRLLDKKTKQLEMVSGCGLSKEYMNKGPVDADKSLARALAGEPHFVLDATSDPSVQYPEAAVKEGISSMLAVPLKGREKVIGTMRLYTAEKKTFSQEELDFIYALAGQGAISIENAEGYDILEKQDKAKSEFIFMMTHELKGPLMAIQSLLEVMQKGYVGTLTEKQQELIDRIYKRIDSVMEVSTGLLDIYQWQSQKPQVEWVPLSLKEYIEKAVDLYRMSAEEKKLTLNAVLPEMDPIIMATDVEIEKILNNLITNAIKYTPAEGRILLTLSEKDDQVLLSVRDTGIGIPSEEREKIFDDFFRTQEAKKIDPYGRGIGLPLVKRVVDALGGDIRVDSREGEGSEFILTFPKAPAAQ